MNDIEPRVERTEIEILHLKLDRLADRLEQIESDTKKRSGMLSRVKDIAAILTPLIVAAIGFYATYSISGAIEQEKLKLDHLTAMQGLMSNLLNPGIDLPAAESAAVSLAAFGPNAVVPLIHELQASGHVRPLAAEEGLRTVAFRYPSSTCAMLTDVLRNDTGLFSWEAHSRVIRLLGDIGCAEATDVLMSYKARLSGPDALEAYKTTVRTDPEPTKKILKKLQETIDSSIAKIEKN